MHCVEVRWFTVKKIVFESRMSTLVNKRVREQKKNDTEYMEIKSRKLHGTFSFGS